MTADEATVERCAMALRDYVANRSAGTGREGRMWIALPLRLKQDYRNEAKVVLEAAGVRCG
jgi:hypothetical protein